MSRLLSEISVMPMANLLVIALCCLAFLYQVLDDALDDPKLTCFTLCPVNVIFLHEYYRLITSCFFHGSLMHIGMNMLTAAAVGSFLEKSYGTLRHAFTVLWGILLVPLCYVCVAWVCFTLFKIQGPMYQHSVGFSGVLFQLSVLEANLNPHSQRSVFGMFRVSSSAYPWAMLVIMQFLLPHVSFLGHLSGILVGTLQLYGVFDCILPSSACLREIENCSWIQPLSTKPNFVHAPTEDSEQRRRPGMLLESMKRFAFSGFMLCCNILETLKVFIFGYDRSQRSSEEEALTLSNTNVGVPLSVNYNRDNEIDEEDNIELQAAIAESLSPNEHLISQAKRISV